MPNVLSSAEVQAYERDGYHCPVRVMSEADAVGYRQRLEAFENGADGNIRNQIKTKMHLVLTFIHELVTEPTILDAVEDVLGPDIFCWNATFFIKEPKDPGHVTWHQDATYWGLAPPDVCSAWVALSPATVASGAMKVIPGTHNGAQLAHEDTFDEHNLLTRGQKLAEDPDLSQAISLELATGEISLHHIGLVHGSDPNTTDDRRIGLAIRYIAPHVQQQGDIKDSALLVRGEDRYGNFEHEKPPAADLHPDALAYHAKVLKNMAKVKFAGTDHSYSDAV
ncbi:MAG TPA: phytanoyl-CoA dioxygenase [Rhodospirillaceae bacterium]|nr:phytanoyl-CoA dioxygenase [Rhodospirillaceae bacterium]HAA93441.1 phytanoyl-CoA dioxygenase [Rhodospirillaceae bacterium]HAT34531.1 phytanoyl-CoA dioxygenase [Rhodospirillaceae bacterium]|tara:strand:+ start:197 stop:1036 length:840 start_codon:yes stop_codon:yes gene_type:complete